MKSKLMIISAIILTGLLMVFLQKAFNSIQKASVELVFTDEEPSVYLDHIAEDVIGSYHVPFVDDISFKDLKLNVLLIDHQEGRALLIQDLEKLAVDYDHIPQSVSYCNTYIIEVDGEETMIINTDSILGDPYVRTLAYGYHYRYAKMNTLNPENIDYFVTADQDKDLRFLRYMMIESAKEALLNDTHMDVLYYYYDEWSTLVGDDGKNNVANYDFYDGFLAFVKLKVMERLNPDLELETYLQGYVNDEGIYYQDDEFEVMGLLYCLLAEREGKQIIQDDKRQTNPYTGLLRNSVIGDGHEDADFIYQQFSQSFDNQINQVKQIIDDQSKTLEIDKHLDMVITSETYSHAIKLGKQTYIYMDYSARLEGGSIFTQPYQVVKISPIKVYYLEN